MATLPPRTIYEIAKPQQQFYSVERAGFTSVNSAAISICTDLVQLGAFTLANLKYTVAVGTSTSDGYTDVWPPELRDYKLSSGGRGYKVGEKINLVGGTGTKFEAEVMSITTKTVGPYTYGGVIDTFKVNNLGSYSVPPTPSETVPTQYTSDTYALGTVTINGNVTLSAGTAVSPPAPNGDVGANDFGTWATRFGAKGGGGTVGTRWPTTGAWFFNADLTAPTVIGDIKVGANVTLVSGDVSSIVPPGTFVTEIKSIAVVTGAQRTGSYWSGFQYPETTTSATYILFNQPVTFTKGDKISFKGEGATFDNTELNYPTQWTGVFDATGAVDPLNDTVGVFGNVAVATVDSNVVQITNISTANAYDPVIYPGQDVGTRDPNDPDPIPSNIRVVDVENYYEVSGGSKIFKANVTLSANLTLDLDKGINFRFTQRQPWRLAVQIHTQDQMSVYAATRLQIKDDCSISKVYNNAGTHVDWAGLIGSKWSDGATLPDENKTDEGFYNRKKRVGLSPENYPINYSVSITNRGLFVGMWEGNWSTMQQATVSAGTDNYFNWFLIQRAVNRLTGRVVTTGRCPVFCVNAVGYKYWKFIVREEDVVHPTVGPVDSKYENAHPLTEAISTTSTPYRVPANYHTHDSFAILNTTNQISLTEDSKYLLGFLNNLTTPRFRYSDELDMIGQTSADVVGQGVELAITAYGQSLPRYYRALPANNKYNTGLRICVIKDIPAA